MLNRMFRIKIKELGVYEERTYRNQIHSDKMRTSFRVVVKETDLFIRAGKDLKDVARESVLRHRGYLENYIRQHAEFAETLIPWIVSGPSPEIVREMAHAGQLAVSSTKSHLGHTLGASGGIELVICSLTIDRGVITPTINYQTPDPACDLDYTPNQAREARVDAVVSNSFGFGGHNASLLLARLAS